MISISLFSCGENIWMNGYINKWMIWKNSMKLYSHVNMEDITDADYTHAKRVCKKFETKLLKNVKIYMSKVIHYSWLMYLITCRICVLKYMNLTLLILYCSRLAWQTALKKTILVTDIGMLLMVEYSFKGGICHQYVEDNNKYMENYNKKKKDHILRTMM